MRSDFKRLGSMPSSRPEPNGYSDYSRFFRSKLESKEDDCVKECIENIIMTQKGERIFNLSFGAGLIQYIGEPHGDNDAEMRDQLLDAISYQEPRIEMFRSKSFVQSDPVNHTVRIRIAYRIVQTGELGVFDKTAKMS